MALPIEVDTVEVRGDYVQLDGTSARGVVKFSLKGYLASKGAKTQIVPSTKTATLDANGRFTVNLPAADDPDLSKTGWKYLVQERLFTSTRDYEIIIPLSAKESGVDLADLAPGGTGGGTTTPPDLSDAIRAENALPGVPQATWDVNPLFPAGHPTIQGFATAMSVLRGGTLPLKIHSPNSTFTGKVYRLGYYNGDGAREIATITGAQTTQPSGTVNSATGMVSCANWTASGTWTVPVSATPGVYVIKVYRDDNPEFSSHIGPFVVQSPNRKAPLTVTLSDPTWQAYNYAGANPADIFAGKSLYGVGTSTGFNYDKDNRARAVSYDRPLISRKNLPQATFWNSEYALIRWFERLGYDVDYLSKLDIDASPSVLLDRQIVVSSGHDEYWSLAVRNAFEAARGTGVHLVFATANEAFWRINPTTAGGRTYSCWKDTHDGAVNASGVYSGTWQDTRGINPERRSPSLLTGQRFRLNGISALAMKAKSAHAAIPFWRNTSVAELSAGQEKEFGGHLVGFEANEPADLNGSTETPAGLLRLTEATYAVTGALSDDNGDVYNLSGNYTHAMTLYRVESGAVVFSTGTNQLAWALDETHERRPGVSQLSVPIQQAIVNLFVDLGTAPKSSLPNGLTPPTAVSLNDYPWPPPLAPGTEVFKFATPPTTPDATDGQPLSLGLRFATRATGTWVGVRIWTPLSNPGTVTVAGYNEDSSTPDVAIATGSTSGVSLGQSVDVMFSGPIQISSGSTYTAAMHAMRFVLSGDGVETWPKDTGSMYTSNVPGGIAKYRPSPTIARPTLDPPGTSHYHISPIVQF